MRFGNRVWFTVIVFGLGLGVLMAQRHNVALLPSPPAGNKGAAVQVRAVSNEVLKQIGTQLKSFVPQIEEVYVQTQGDGGLAIVGTATLRGYSNSYQVAANIASRYVVVAYNDLFGLRVDYAALYIKSDGRYVMAVGLGRTAARQLSITTFAPEEGTVVANALAKIDHFGGALTNQAFAQYTS